MKTDIDLSKLSLYDLIQWKNAPIDDEWRNVLELEINRRIGLASNRGKNNEKRREYIIRRKRYEAWKKRNARKSKEEITSHRD